MRQMKFWKALSAVTTAFGLLAGERFVATDGRDLREEFRSPQGAARENTGPLFWMHGTETPERLREYVGRVDNALEPFAGPVRVASGWRVASTLTDRPDLARCENGQLSLGTNAGILLMLERQ